MSSIETITDLVNVPFEVESQDKTYYNFRYQRDVTEIDIRTEIQRNDIAWFLTHGLADQSFSKGWDVVKPNTEEPVDWNDKFQDKLKLVLKDFIKGVGIERGYGNTLFCIFNDNDNEVQLRSFEPRDYRIKQDDFGKLTAIFASEAIIGNSDPKERNWQTDEELKNVFHSVNRLGRKRGQGVSYLIPVWDPMVSIGMLNEHTGLFIIRTGAGRLVVTAPMELLKDPVFQGMMATALTQLNSASSVLFVPIMTGATPGSETKIENVTDTISYAPLDLRKLYVQAISAKSGVPALILDGDVRTYASAEQNSVLYLDVLQKIQAENDEEARWLTQRIAEKYLDVSDTNWELRMKVREELTEKGKLDMTDHQMSVLAGIMKDQVLLQISLEDAMKLVGIKYQTTKIEPKIEPNKVTEISPEQLLAEEEAEIANRKSKTGEQLLKSQSPP